MKTLPILIAVSLVLSACKQDARDESGSRKRSPMPATETSPTPETSSVALPKGFERASPTARRAMTEHLQREPYLRWREAEDRKELVRKASDTPAARGAGLFITLKKTVLSPGESLWYRVELRNHGKAELFFDDTASFFKDSACEKSKFQLSLTDPDGSKMIIRRESDVEPTVGGDIVRAKRLPSGDPKTQTSRLEESMRRSQDERFGLHLTLLPGETLRTRPADGFRRLQGSYELVKRGRYRLTITYAGGKGFPEPVAEGGVEFEVKRIAPRLRRQRV